MNRQSKGTSAGGQFAPSTNSESTIELTTSSSSDQLSYGDCEIDGHKYSVAKLEETNDTVRYMLDAQEGGGWRINYDRLTRRATVRGVTPAHKTAEWRERGEADIRKVLSTLESDAQLFELDRKTYRVYGPSFPLSESQLAGINSGQMMLTGGNSEDELLIFVDHHRIELDRQADARPDLMPAIEENRRYIEGVEFAARMGRAAAEAGTVSAMARRGL